MGAKLDLLKRSLLEGPPGSRDVQETALRIAAVIEPVVQQLADPMTTPLGRELVDQFISSIANDADSLAAAGYRAAEQAALAIDVLHRPYLRNVTGTDREKVKETVDRLFERVGDPNQYRPTKFAEALRAVQDALGPIPTGPSPMQ